MSTRLKYFIVRKPGWDSELYVHHPDEAVEDVLRELYANHTGAQIDVLTICTEGLGGNDICDGHFYLDGVEAMKHAPEYDDSDD